MATLPARHDRPQDEDWRRTARNLALACHTGYSARYIGRDAEYESFLVSAGLGHPFGEYRLVTRYFASGHLDCEECDDEPCEHCGAVLIYLAIHGEVRVFSPPPSRAEIERHIAENIETWKRATGH